MNKTAQLQKKIDEFHMKLAKNPTEIRVNKRLERELEDDIPWPQKSYSGILTTFLTFYDIPVVVDPELQEGEFRLVLKEPEDTLSLTNGVCRKMSIEYQLPGKIQEEQE